jgi:hypothetical protein
MEAPQTAKHILQDCLAYKRLGQENTTGRKVIGAQVSTKEYGYVDSRDKIAYIDYVF